MIKYLLTSLTVVMLILIGTTMWATTKSKERTSCYKTAYAVDECAQPSDIEEFIRDLYK